MKLYLTKYALSSGIEEVTTDDDPNGYVRIKEHPFLSYKVGKDLFVEKRDAVNHANEMKIKKLKSLDKQIKKISAINFDA